MVNAGTFERWMAICAAADINDFLPACNIPNILNNETMQTGWLCPRCGTVNAPFVRTCEGSCVVTEASTPVLDGALMKARLAAGFESATDAARAFNWNENTYRSHENGQRGLRPAQACLYANAFGVDPASLVFSLSPLPGRISSLRKKLGLSQVDFAERIGATQSTVSKWEKGLQKPTVEAAAILAREAGASVEDFVLG